tara:strand:- start:142 stop:504 length:363 start_codon:yes stop_codon:yes gene_type:complete
LLTKFASPIFASQGPLRTLSARTFDALLNDTSPRENEVRALDASIALNPPPDAADASPRATLAPPLGRQKANLSVFAVQHAFPRHLEPPEEYSVRGVFWLRPITALDLLYPDTDRLYPNL